MIREQDPLKQGLKLRRHDHNPVTNCIREQDPLKQGLKQDKIACAVARGYENSRARSTKTRIETNEPYLQRILTNHF